MIDEILRMHFFLASDVKIVVVGDSYIGKTCMVESFIQDKFPEKFHVS